MNENDPFAIVEDVRREPPAGGAAGLLGTPLFIAAALFAAWFFWGRK